MSTMSDDTGELISDGKRMRLVWQPGDGDGDSAAHLVERSMNLVRGHPTWKVFVDEIEVPVVRGSEDEPPHYVYLDDRSCYTVWCSKSYTNQEMREFWPWDFNHQGHIKEGRMNRGHPAYLDDSCTEFAQGKLRRKGMWYTFQGAPDIVNYEPVRPKVPTKMEQEVAQEFAEDTQKTLKNVGGNKSEGLRKPSKAKSLSITESADASHHATTEDNPDQSERYDALKESILQPTDQDMLLLKKIFRPSPKTKTTPSSLPRSSAGYTYEHVYTPRDLGPGAALHAKRAMNEAPQKTSEQSPTPSSLKRTYAEPIEYDSMPKKRVHKTTKRKSSGLGGDGANDEERIIDLEGDYAVKRNERLPSGLLNCSNCESQVEALQRENDQLVRESRSLRISLAHVTIQRDHYRKAITALLTANMKQQNGLGDRIAALQQFVNSMTELIRKFEELTTTATKEIAPTCTLSEGLLTHLDAAGKYLYGQGMDEEWKEMHDEAKRIAGQQ